jgi:hypothetical protein
MNRTTEKSGQVWKAAVLMIVFLAWSFVWSPAKAVSEILPINPVPDFQASETWGTGSQKMIVHGRGIIGRIGKNEMVISDILLPISPSITYYSEKTGYGLSLSDVKVGAIAGFRLNSKRQIIELWLLDEEKY